MNSLNQVVQRVASIERRFSTVQGNKANQEDFGEVLKAIEGKLDTNPTVSSFNGGRGNIASMVQSAAVKYGVNPKLALAVAEAESGLTPDVVSSAGAVGVMQLMPETASALGVNNINDPRQNVDGGVRYLKQMLTIFHGDVKKAVAAYNAGPQAVMNYKGIPPYRETQEYVARVLSLAK